MKLDGRSVKLRKDLGYRMVKPGIDKDKDGNILGEDYSNYVAIVKISDCKIREEEVNGVIVHYYDASEAPNIPVNHCGTYYGYGEWKLRTSQSGVRVLDNNGNYIFSHKYAQCTVYYVYKGKIYSASIKRTLKGLGDHILSKLGVDPKEVL